jgi:phospholipase C
MKRLYSIERRNGLGQRRITRRQLGTMTAGAALSALVGSGLPSSTPARATSTGLQQVQHIVVVMQENHSFDNYFGRLPALGQPDADGLPGDAANPDPTNPGGPAIAAFHADGACAVSDLDHSWNGTHLSINGGRMDGFTATNLHPLDPNGSRAMAYHTDDELNFYYSLYSQFAIGDRYFSSVPGPTFPNRFYLLAGTSFGHIFNALPDLQSDPNAFAPPNGTIFEQLDRAGVSWKVYFSQVPFAILFGYVRKHWWNLVPISRYYFDAILGRLPQVAFIDPTFVGSPNVENDEHPPSNIQIGQRYVAGIIRTLMASPNWSSSVLFHTYDEHGGYYDHVAPPAATPPDNIAPMLRPGDVAGAFDQYGVRVPVAVVSPFSKQAHVSHAVYDHTSILKFISTRFNLPPLTNRVAAADAMLDFFDFENPPFVRPPQLPITSINLASYFQCMQVNQVDRSSEVSAADLLRIWSP